MRRTHYRLWALGDNNLNHSDRENLRKGRDTKQRQYELVLEELSQKYQLWPSGNLQKLGI